MADVASLQRRASISLIQFAVAMAAILFLGAGEIAWWQAWAFMAVFLACCIVTTALLVKSDPALVERRMRAGATAEQRGAQKLIQALNTLLFLALLVVPALDRRFGWSHVPAWVAVLGDVLTVAGFAAIFRVFRENSFAAATVQVAEGQHVVSTGPYAVVRHPMYAGAMPLIFGASLALGSYWGLAVAALMTAGIVWRLLDEERYLAANLPGYEAYRRKVRFRLAPGLF
jgi:protein-S-isoprenylcysteine O-methyltransferase Ste14